MSETQINTSIIQEYSLSYNDFLLALNQTHVITQLAVKFLDNFPNQLPPNWKQFYMNVSSELKKEFTMVGVNSIKADDPFIGALIMSDFFFSRVYDNQPIHFIKALASINLVIFFSHLEAFIADSIRIVAKVKPDIVPNGEAEFEQRLDKFIKKITMPGVRDVLESLRKQGISITINDNIDMEFITRSELQRNAYVHNGGRANSLYINKANDRRFKIGDDIVFIEWSTLLTNLIALGGDIYLSICKEYLGGKQGPIWKLGEPTPISENTIIKTFDVPKEDDATL